MASLLVPEAYEVLKRENFGYFLTQCFYPVKALHVPCDLCYAIAPEANINANGFLPSMVSWPFSG